MSEGAVGIGIVTVVAVVAAVVSHRVIQNYPVAAAAAAAIATRIFQLIVRLQPAIWIHSFRSRSS
jgi:hypothetical protein